MVDMQNDFGSPGGMFDRAGVPIEGIRAAVEPTARVLTAARAAGMHVVYLTMEHDPTDDASPHALKHAPLGAGEIVRAPDGRDGRILGAGTWNTEVLPELAPEAGDAVVAKRRYSGFFDTDLDAVLRSRGVSTLVFTGCTTSICVESTLRDAFYRDYRCLLLEDCTAEPIGGDLARTNHEASVLVIETVFGWVSRSGALLAALGERTAAAAPA